MRKKRSLGSAAAAAALVLCAGAALAFVATPRAPRVVVSVRSLSISKLPFVIAMDEGLYARNGLNVELWVPNPSAPDKVLVRADPWARLVRALGLGARPDIYIDGATPMIVNVASHGPGARQIVLASTDCAIRAHVVGRRGITSVEELKGKRLGVSGLSGTAGFHALVLAQKMGWDPKQDISIIEDVEIGRVLDGSVDAIIAYEGEYAAARRAGLPILLDMKEVGGSVGGNSVKVNPDWLQDPGHREAAARFLKATAEAIAIFHQQPQVAMDVMQRRYAIRDAEEAKTLYARGAWIPKKPYPCYEGIQETMRLYDSNEMRRYRATDFYDDSIIRDIDRSGFMDSLYRPTTAITERAQ